MALNLARGRGQGADDGGQVGRTVGVLHLGRGGAEGLAIGGLGLAGVVDGLGHGGEFAVQYGADVANFLGQAAARQELSRQHFGRGVGEGDVAGQKPLKFAPQRTLGIADVVQPQLEVQRGRPDGGLLHGVHDAVRQSICLRTPKGGFDLRRHSDSRAPSIDA
ncbi:hypothetical protein D3C86_1254810 [compost metagenome]